MTKAYWNNILLHTMCENCAEQNPEMVSNTYQWESFGATRDAKVLVCAYCKKDIPYHTEGIELIIGIPSYYQVGIRPANSGFGMYEQENTNASEPWESEQELLNASKEGICDEYRIDREEIYELGVDELPEAIEDIRGSIQYEKGRIFGYLRANRYIRGVAEEDHGYTAEYFAIVKKVQ